MKYDIGHFYEKFIEEIQSRISYRSLHVKFQVHSIVAGDIKYPRQRFLPATREVISLARRRTYSVCPLLVEN
jgi:hypothetical protein